MCNDNELYLNEKCTDKKIKELRMSIMSKIYIYIYIYIYISLNVYRKHILRM